MSEPTQAPLDLDAIEARANAATPGPEDIPALVAEVRRLRVKECRLIRAMTHGCTDWPKRDGLILSASALAFLRWILLGDEEANDGK